MLDKAVLIELVREREVLWNQKDKNFHNHTLRQKLWHEVGQGLGIKGDVARKHWHLLRDGYRKKIKETMGVSSTAAKTKWFYYDALNFLFPMMRIRGNLPEETDPLDLDEDSVQTPRSESDFDVLTKIEYNDYDPEELTQVSEAHQPSTTSLTTDTTPENSKFQHPGFKRKHNQSNENESLNPEKVQVLEFPFASQPSTSSVEEDDDLCFFKSLIPSLKELPRLRRLKLRSKILNCVIAELESGQPSNRP